MTADARSTPSSCAPTATVRTRSCLRVVAAALFGALLVACQATGSEHPSVDAATIGLQVAAPDAQWVAATGWGVRGALTGSASVKNGSDREIWYLGSERSIPVFFVLGRTDGDDWAALPSNVETPALRCAWHRLAPGAEVSGPLEAFADPQPIRIRFRASHSPPSGDRVEAFDALSPVLDVPEAPAR